ncbi:dihydrofolate reductase [bacterium]|nr:dihydrofolate reductase [bacterium]
MKLIVSMCKNRGIGYHMIKPWIFKTEEELFNKITTGNGNNAVVMGKQTYLRNPPYVNRKELVLFNKTFSSHWNISENFIKAFDFIDEKKFEDVWVIGGESVFQQALHNPKLSEIHILENNKHFHCNLFFPELEKDKFKLAAAATYVENDLIITHSTFKKS